MVCNNKWVDMRGEEWCIIIIVVVVVVEAAVVVVVVVVVVAPLDGIGSSCTTDMVVNGVW